MDFCDLVIFEGPWWDLVLFQLFPNSFVQIISICRQTVLSWPQPSGLWLYKHVCFKIFLATKKIIFTVKIMQHSVQHKRALISLEPGNPNKPKKTQPSWNLTCPPFSIDAARMIRTYCFIPVAIELQGKAQARSVQVTSEPSAVVPVEQKQVTKGTPNEMMTQTKFPGFYSISQGFAHRALLRQHGMKFQLLKAAERRQVDDFRANEVRLYLSFFWPFHAVFHRVNCKRFQGPLEIFTSAPQPMTCFQPAPLEKLDIAKV